ncbi:unnamed protein product [Allacma fusca]|uniref:C-type lectin domain-containing protein n=1 Tax=Allacma fusca TaxID=39272 RepID=A0A8J2JXF2_9HEXA|nr:unnamed protein product [Allacma fusca]
MFERDVEKRPLTSSVDESTVRGPNYTKSFLGQLCLMGIFTFLMWMVLFSLGGFFPPQANVTVTVCETPRQVNQAFLNPVIEQTEVVVASFMTDNLDNLTLLIETASAELDTEQDSGANALEDMVDFVQAGEIIPVVFNEENVTDALITALLKSNLNHISPEDTYYISASDELLNWFEALQQCMFLEMQLVAVNSVEKHEEIQELLLSKGSPDGDFWTAGTNLWTDSDDYFWASTGESFTFMGWLELEETNNEPEKHNCVQIKRALNLTGDGYSYRWNDNGCHIKSRFICERL